MIEMEKQQMLREDKLDDLQRILEKCDKQLASMIKDYKDMYIGQGTNKNSIHFPFKSCKS